MAKAKKKEALTLEEKLEQALVPVEEQPYEEANFYGKPFKNAEVSAVYIYDKEVDITKLKLQEEEVESVCWMDYEVALKEIREENRQGSYEKYCVFLDEFEQLGQWLREKE